MRPKSARETGPSLANANPTRERSPLRFANGRPVRECKTHARMPQSPVEPSMMPRPFANAKPIRQCGKPSGMAGRPTPPPVRCSREVPYPIGQCGCHKIDRPCFAIPVRSAWPVHSPLTYSFLNSRPGHRPPAPTNCSLNPAPAGPALGQLLPSIPALFLRLRVAEGCCDTLVTLSIDPYRGAAIPLIKVDSRHHYMGLVWVVQVVVGCRWVLGGSTPPYRGVEGGLGRREYIRVVGWVPTPI
jgi:hypothetical protein